jgi:hypothetical protein
VNQIIQKIQEVAKMLAALVGSLTVVLVGLIPDEWGKYLAIAAAVLTAIATYAIPNATPADPDPNLDSGVPPSEQSTTGD